MAATNQGLNLKLDLLPKDTQEALNYLAGQSWLKADKWYLAGGTAMALQAGHRLSVDLDFFTAKPDFEAEFIINELAGKRWTTALREKGTLHGELHNTKVSFISYPNFVPQKPYLQYRNINILDIRDIAVTKVLAVSQRGRKRDFIDIYWYVKNREPLLEVLRRAEKQYPSPRLNFHHILKSLTYFEAAEEDPDPQLFFADSWDEIKKYFLTTVPAIARELL